jgi:hypothetical protein
MDCPTCSTAAPVTIRTVDDINANDKRISGLALRAAYATCESLSDIGYPAQLFSFQAVDLLVRVLRMVLIDEPATGEAVDIAGHHFESDLRRHLLGLALGELGDSEGEA